MEIGSFSVLFKAEISRIGGSLGGAPRENGIGRNLLQGRNTVTVYTAYEACNGTQKVDTLDAKWES